MTTFALIGDSQGVGVQDELSRLLPIVFADPKVGWTTARISGEPFDRALGSSADTILLMTGGNDSPVSADALLGMVERTRRARKRLIVVGPVFALTDDAARHDRARAQLQTILAPAVRASPGVVRWVDAYPMTRDLASTANVHLTAARYRTYAARIANAVRGSSTGIGVLGWGALAFVVAYAITRDGRRAATVAILPP